MFFVISIDEEVVLCGSKLSECVSDRMYESEKQCGNDDDSKPPDISSTARKRFTPEEDARLKALASSDSFSRWEQIASKMPGRTARQCRDRYNNYLYKQITSAPWTAEEDKYILKMYQKIGPKWADISKLLNGRSGNNVKNRWYKFLKKQFESSNKISESIPQPEIPQFSYSFDEWEAPLVENDGTSKRFNDFEFIDW